jgi:hypothetical protein
MSSAAWAARNWEITPTEPGKTREAPGSGKITSHLALVVTPCGAGKLSFPSFRVAARTPRVKPSRTGELPGIAPDRAGARRLIRLRCPGTACGPGPHQCCVTPHVDVAALILNRAGTGMLTGGGSSVNMMAIGTAG